MTLTSIQDPGKDLFAYLFLLIMVFSFMLLMTTEERHKNMENKAAPENRPSITASSAITKLPKKQLGMLVRNNLGIFLSFGGKLYDPANDIARLRSDGRIISSREGDEEVKSILYLIEDDNSRVLLSEYLSAFQKLGSQGIRVAFAKRVH